MGQLDIYSFFRSTATWRVRIALNLKAVDHSLKLVWVRGDAHQTPEYLDKNPHGLVPAMQVGQTVFGQSMAMLEYLEEAFPEPPLLPQELLSRAQVRAAAQLIACDVHPLNNRRVLQYLKADLALSPDQVLAWEHKWVAAGYAGLEGQVQKLQRSTGPYLFGDTVTMADLCLVPQVENGNRAGVDIGDYPALASAYAALNDLPAFEKAHPRNQPDNPNVTP